MDELAVAIPCTTTKNLKAFRFTAKPYISPCSMYYIELCHIYIRINNNYKQDILSFLRGIIFSRLPHPHLFLYFLSLVLVPWVYKYLSRPKATNLTMCTDAHTSIHQSACLPLFIIVVRAATAAITRLFTFLHIYHFIYRIHTN